MILMSSHVELSSLGNKKYSSGFKESIKNCKPECLQDIQELYVSCWICEPLTIL